MQNEAIYSTASLQMGLNEAKIRKSTYLRNPPQVCFRVESRLRNLPQVCFRVESRLRNLPQVCFRAESRLRNLPQVVPERNHVCGRFRKHDRI